jgi:hypothetical protein
MKDKATSRRQTAFALTVFAIVMKMALSSLASFFIGTSRDRLSLILFFWRKGWDSNPRNPFEVHSISSAASSAAPAPFLKPLLSADI